MGKKGIDWSENEVSHLVADYFEMLQLELAGKKYVKAEHNRRLRQVLDDRNRPSVEFKYRNVSAVLLQMGLPYVDGYKPASHFERSLLVDGVKKFLDANPSIFATIDKATEAAPDVLPKIDKWQDILETPPEEMLLPDEPSEPWQSRQGRKIDFVQREAGNRRLGRAGEEFTVTLERNRLLGLGRDDLAKKVEWVSDAFGDGLGFDILSHWARSANQGHFRS